MPAKQIEKFGGADKAEPIDLSTLDTIKGSNEGAGFDVLHPGNNKKIGTRIEMFGPDSKVANEAYNKLSESKMSRLRQGHKDTPESARVDSCNYLAGLTKGWDILVDNGKNLPFSITAASDIYYRYPWIKEQADAYASKRGNFLAD